MFIISRLPFTHVSNLIKIFSVLFASSRDPVSWMDEHMEGQRVYTVISG
jgi:hypothetical protein